MFNANYQDRSPSPARNRSRSPSHRRDYEASRDSGRNDRRDNGRDNRRDHRRDDRRDNRRDDRRGGFRRDGGGDRGRRTSGGDDIQRNYSNSIFIGNVPFESTTADIEQMFGLEGRIVHAGVISNKGRSRGMAFVEYDSKQAADEAIRKFDRTTLGGREIFVRQDMPPPEDRRRDDRRDDRRDNDSRRNDRREERPRERRERGSDAPRPGTEVFVGNLPFSTTWHTLKDLFREAGEVIRADVMTSKFGKSRGFGTVVFGTPEDAENAVAKFQNYVLDGRNLEVRPGKEPGERRKPAVKNSDFTEGVYSNGEPSNTIFVANLPFITTQTDLFELFETIGRVTRAEIQFNHTGRASGNAVVEFESVDLADLAIKNLDRYNYGGRDLEISFAQYSNPRGPVEDMEQDFTAPEEPVQQTAEVTAAEIEPQENLA